jgi:hypothetical protein
MTAVDHTLKRSVNRLDTASAEDDWGTESRHIACQGAKTTRTKCTFKSQNACQTAPRISKKIRNACLGAHRKREKVEN